MTKIKPVYINYIFTVYIVLLLIGILFQPVLTYETKDIKSNIINLIPLGSSPSPGYIIDGNTVSWENSYGRLEVYPHTSTNLITQKQYAEFTWKLGDNNIDLAFRFDNPISNSDIWLWQNISHNVRVPTYGEIPDNYTLYDIVSFNELLEIPEIVDYGDTSSNYYYEGITGNATTYIIGFDSFNWLNPGHTAAVFNYSYYGVTGYHIEQQYWFDWNSKKASFQHTVYNNKHYYYVSDLSVIQNKVYNFKWQYDIPINSQGKWELLGKLHSDTIQEALSSGHYILLDPWWDTDWDYKKKITIDHDQVNCTLTNFPVLINISSDADLVSHVAQANGEDIAFTNAAEDTQFNHEIEYWDAVTGQLVVWVNVTTLSHADDTVIYMYYGNSSCADQQDITGTWDINYSGVWHMKDLLDSTANDNDGTNYGADFVTGDIDGSTDFVSANSDYIDYLDLSSYMNTLQVWFKADTYLSLIHI